MSDLEYRRMADSDFQKARSRQLFSRLVSVLQGQKDDMLSFRDVRSILKPRSETYLGMRTVPVSRIVGSEGRYRDFNRSFLPRRQHLKPRWTNVDLAHYREVNLPPIKLYELGGVYFVSDGNHRVSVARSRSVEFIDAEVVSLNSEIKLDPGVTDEDLRAQGPGVRADPVLREHEARQAAARLRPGVHGARPLRRDHHAHQRAQVLCQPGQGVRDPL